MKWWAMWLLFSPIPWGLTLFFVELRIWPGVVFEGVIGSIGLFMAFKRFRQNR